MKAGFVASLSALVAGTFAQANDDTFEPSDFYITEVLTGNGVNISAIPELSGLVERALDLNPCSIAVDFILFTLARR